MNGKINEFKLRMIGTGANNSLRPTRFAMSYLIVGWFLGLCCVFSAQKVLAQGILPKCYTGIMVNRGPYSKKITISQNEKFVAKVGSGTGDIYELIDSSYQLKSSFKLEETLPRYAVITNAGTLVVFGQERLLGNGRAESDLIYVYEDFGNSFRTIGAEDVFSSEQIEETIEKYESLPNCTPVKPWICHTQAPIRQMEDYIRVRDTLGGYVSINLVTLEVSRSELFSQCDMFGQK